MPPFQPFQLSVQLSTHEADVRSVFSPSASLIVSSSRDKSAIAWVRGADGWTLGKRWEGLGGFVGAAWAGVIGGTNYVVTGSQDALINAYAVPEGATSSSELQAAASDDPARTAIGHSANVCCLDGLPDGSGIVSGSWDKTAIVWSSSFEQAQVLKGHEQTVWAIKAISPTQILTGSADKTIVLWTKNGDQWAQTRKFIGHTDAVRCIVKIPGGDTFASSGNDGTIIIWSLSGERIIDLYGHSSFVYGLTVLPPTTPDGEPELASVSEDRTLRIWSETGKNVQTIPHPAVSVWTVAATADGELATGSSDGVVRVWTRHAERVASAADVKSYEEAVSKQQVDVANQIGDVKKENVPGIEALGRDGKKEGEVLMVKNEKNVVEAHQWSSASKSWQKIGEVVDAVGSGRKQLFNGVEYDYVFDVDIAEGQPALKLPYNASDNPFTAAQDFLQRNELPLSYIDQVVQVIETNSAKQTIGQDAAASQYVDPYTGASRYQSNSNSVPMAATGVGYVDPYSGTARYTGGAPSAVGGGGESSAAASRRPDDILPVSAPLTFRQANVEALSKKLLEFDASLRSGPDAGVAMTAEETRNVKDIAAFLSLPKGALPNPENTIAKEGWDVPSLFAVVPRWPAAQRFPLIDLVRLLAPVSPSLASHRPRSPPSSVVELLLVACDWRSAWTPTKERETNTMLALRALANVFGTKNGKLAMVEAAETLFACFAVAPYDQFNKNIRVALATVLLNYSVIAVRSGFPRPSVAPGLLEIVLKLVTLESVDGEAAFRLGAAFGNLVASTRVSGSLQVGKVAQGKTHVGELARRFPAEERLAKLGAEIGRLSA